MRLHPHITPAFTDISNTASIPSASLSYKTNMVKIKELKECWQRLRNRKSGGSGNKSSEVEGREKLPAVQPAPPRKLRHQFSGLLPRLQRQPSPPRPASHEFSAQKSTWRFSNNTASLDYTTGDATASEDEDGKKRPRTKLSLYAGCSTSPAPSFSGSWDSNDPYHSGRYQAMKQRLGEPLTTPPPSFPDASVSPFRYSNKRDSNVIYQPALTPPQELQPFEERLTTPPPPTRSTTTPSPPAIFAISPSPPPPRRPRTPVPKKEKRRPGLNLGTSLRLHRTNSSTNENPSPHNNSSTGNKKQNKSLRQRQKEREKEINRHMVTPEGKEYQAKLADYSFPPRSPTTPTKKPPPQRRRVHKSGWEKRVAAATGGRQLGNYDASDEDSHSETTTTTGLLPPPWLPLPRRSSSTISPCSSRPGSPRL
ncbi:hypothetical protein V8F33_001278 [Rhypophila sp. PSN 637]